MSCDLDQYLRGDESLHLFDEAIVKLNPVSGQASNIAWWA